MENNEKIYELISTTSFDELSDKEKEMVLNTISEEDYRKMHYLEMKIQKDDTFSEENWILNPTIKRILIKKFETKNSQKAKLFAISWQIINFKVPAYQYALLLILVFVSSFYFQGQNKKVDIAENPKIVYRTIVDTVLIEKEKVITWVSKPNIRKKRRPELIVDQKYNNLIYSEAIPQITFLDSNYKYGSSLRDDSILKNFITKVQ